MWTSLTQQHPSNHPFHRGFLAYKCTPAILDQRTIFFILSPTTLGIPANRKYWPLVLSPTALGRCSRSTYVEGMETYLQCLFSGFAKRPAHCLARRRFAEAWRKDTSPPTGDKIQENSGVCFTKNISQIIRRK